MKCNAKDTEKPCKEFEVFYEYLHGSATLGATCYLNPSTSQKHPSSAELQLEPEAGGFSMSSTLSTLFPASPEPEHRSLIFKACFLLSRHWHWHSRHRHLSRNAKMHLEDPNVLRSRDMMRACRQVETESSCPDNVGDIVHLLQQHLQLEARDVHDMVLALYRISKIRNRRQNMVHPDVPPVIHLPYLQTRYKLI